MFYVILLSLHFSLQFYQRYIIGLLWTFKKPLQIILIAFLLPNFQEIEFFWFKYFKNAKIMKIFKTNLVVLTSQRHQIDTTR